MKISKLFHWLYAILMLLPVMFIGGRSLYVVFNKNAKDSYYGETINDYSYVHRDITNLELNKTYMFANQLIPLNTGYSTGNNYLTIEDLQQEAYFTFTASDCKQILFRYASDTYAYWQFLSENNTLLQNIILTNNQITCTFRLINYSFVNSSSQYDYFSLKVYNKYSFLDNAFIYSVNELNDVPLFSWAKTSFLVQPFSYITGLFGIASDNPINTMLSYWLSISIIWLVFDLVMYVPLLIHRWLDKGVLE